MSIDLTLVLNRMPIPGLHPLAYERIRAEMSRDLHNHIRYSPLVVPFAQGRMLHWYDDEGLEYTETDCYGDRLTSVPAHSLLQILRAHYRPNNRFVQAVLAALPPDTEIILWWN